MNKIKHQLNYKHNCSLASKSLLSRTQTCHFYQIEIQTCTRAHTVTAIFQSQTELCLVLLATLMSIRFLVIRGVCFYSVWFIVFDMIHKRVSLFVCLVHFGIFFFILDFGRFSGWLQEGCSFMHVFHFKKNETKKRETCNYNSTERHIHANRLTFVALLTLHVSRSIS